MSLFEPIPPLYDRVIAMPFMADMLRAMARKHCKLCKTINAEDIWRAVPGDAKNQQAHIIGAIEAGLMEAAPSLHFSRERYRLTREGWRVAGIKRPLEMEVTE